MYKDITSVQLLGYTIVVAEACSLNSRYRALVTDSEGNKVADINWPSSPLQASEEGRFVVLAEAGVDYYEVNLWGSKPGTDDDCWEGAKFETLAAAQACFDDPWGTAFSTSYDRNCTAYFALVRCSREDGTNYVDSLRERKNPDFKPNQRNDDDNDWAREIAQQAGMGMGVESYNDYMGYC